MVEQLLAIVDFSNPLEQTLYKLGKDNRKSSYHTRQCDNGTAGLKRLLQVHKYTDLGLSNNVVSLLLHVCSQV